MLVLGGDLLVFGLAGLQVGHPSLHMAGERLEGLVVKGHQLVGDGAVGELQTEVAAVVPVHQVVQAHVPPVVHKPGQDLQVPPGLLGDIAHPVGDPGGHPHHIVRHHVLLQQGVKDAGGKNGPEGPASSTSPTFMLCSSFSVCRKERLRAAPCLFIIRNPAVFAMGNR